MHAKSGVAPASYSDNQQNHRRVLNEGASWIAGHPRLAAWARRAVNFPQVQLLGENPRPPSAPMKLIVVAPEKIMVVQVLLSLRSWTRASCTAICAPGSRYIRHSALVDRYAEIRFDGSEDDRFIAYVNALERESPGQRLVAADTSGNRLINRVRSRLEVDCALHPGDRVLDLLDDKWEFHRLCARLGLATPDTLFAASKHAIDFEQAAVQLGLPFFVKPAREAQSHGACEIGSMADLRRQLLDNPAYDYAPLVLQRFIRGTDVCANACAFGGRVQALSMQRRLPPEQVDSTIEFFHSSELELVAHALCAATGYDGILNIDARIEEGTGTVWLLEANPRYWRSMSASTWAGLNFVAEHLGRVPASRGLRMLCSGRADTFHHPLLQPRLWRALFFSRHARGRMARWMAVDVCTLVNSLRLKLRGQ